jgi:hypothetical protein
MNMTALNKWCVLVWWLPISGCLLDVNPLEAGDQADDVTNESTASTGESTESTGESTESTGESTESTGESTESTGESTESTGDLPDGCEPVTFLDPESKQPTDVWAGWVRCKDSSFRIEAIDCPAAIGYELCEDANGCDGCDPDEQCLDYYGNGSGFCFCGHNCTSDADCGDNEICACASGVVGNPLATRNTCLPADCSADVDCPAVADDTAPRCRLGHDLCGAPESVHCRTDVDSCIYEEDCANFWCRYDPGDELWSCDEPAICE